jgi:hypothetical protein
LQPEHIDPHAGSRPAARDVDNVYRKTRHDTLPIGCHWSI